MQRIVAAEVAIRALGPEDAEEIVQVHRAAVHQTAAAHYGPDALDAWSPPVTPERIDRYRARIASGEETALVAVENGSVVGFASIVVLLGELRALYVSPAVGRRGVGARLLEAVEELARERGLDELRTGARDGRSTSSEPASGCRAFRCESG
jgi:GNAT superfamily N-acetyltransferase